MTKTTNPKSHWADLLQRAAKSKEIRPEGEGWETFEEINAQHQDIGQNRMHQIIREALDSGDAEMFEGMVINPRTKRLVRCVWYRRLLTS